MWLESSVMAKCLSDEPGSSNASTRSGEALHRHLNSTMRIHLSFKWLREGRCAIHKYSQARAAVQQTQARAAMQHAHARHMQDTRTQARAAMQHTHTCSHTCKTHAHKRGPLCNTQILTSEGGCATHTHKRGPLCNTQRALTSEGRYATDTATRARTSEGRCATHKYSRARAAV